MSDQTQPNDQTQPAEQGDAKQEAAEHVVERVESWHEGAETDTLREELADGMDQAGVETSGEELDRMAEEIHDEGSTEEPTQR